MTSQGEENSEFETRDRILKTNTFCSTFTNTDVKFYGNLIGEDRRRELKRQTTLETNGGLQYNIARSGAKIQAHVLIDTVK